MASSRPALTEIPQRNQPHWDRPVNSGPRPCLFSVGFPLSGLQDRTYTSDLNIRTQHTRSGPPSGRASTTTAASPRQAQSSLLTFRVTGHTALRQPVELRWRRPSSGSCNASSTRPALHVPGGTGHSATGIPYAAARDTSGSRFLLPLKTGDEGTGPCRAWPPPHPQEDRGAAQVTPRGRRRRDRSLERPPPTRSGPESPPLRNKASSPRVRCRLVPPWPTTHQVGLLLRRPRIRRRSSSAGWRPQWTPTARRTGARWYPRPEPSAAPCGRSFRPRS